MKKGLKILIALISVVLLGLTTVSCSKDEMIEKKLVGKWQSTSVTQRQYDRSGNLVSEETESCINWYVAFNIKADGTGQLIDYEEDYDTYTYPMTWIVMDEKLIIIAKDGESTDTITFEIVKIKGSTMTLLITENYTDGKEVFIYDFKKL